MKPTPTMDFLAEKKDPYGKQLGLGSERDTLIQIVISVVIGLAGFLGFCFLRPRWPGLYAARKKHKQEASELPALGDSFFGWTVVLWRITEQQVLASAGLDAYVFLRFFKMAIKFLTVTLFFALVVIKPVHDAFPPSPPPKNRTDHEALTFAGSQTNLATFDTSFDIAKNHKDKDATPKDYMWMYLVFVYVFTGVAVYLLITETERIIDLRQEYLGHSSTIGDRTIRLSGIPKDLRSEEKIKELIEELQIGKVESVTLCKNYEELDDALDRRMSVLRKLEESMTVYLGNSRGERSEQTLPISQPLPPEPSRPGASDDETGPLLEQEGGHVSSGHDERQRPQITLSSGILRHKRKKVDAIDYYEEQLRQLDEKIQSLRKTEVEPMPLAFVTLDSVPACQMAVQAVLDPSPMNLMAKPSPAPEDVVWRNTYMARSNRMLRGWAITVAIALLTVFWSVVLVPIAGILNVETIKKVWPELADAIQRHAFAASLVKTQVPTLLTSLLFVAVPFLYEWLSNLQGMTSQGDVELSVISKNFFFVFFNYFIIFTLLGTFSNFYGLLAKFQGPLKDPAKVANTLAESLERLLPYYTNLIILQGIGLLPLRLLEFGSVALYPIYRIGAKTPRDYAELVQPPRFSYGLYLPQVMLIFVISIVYSILRESWKVILASLAFFLLGSFIYKYQLLYAMDHSRHSTGKAWMMMCNRMIIGLVLLQVTVAGKLSFSLAWTRAGLVVPLIIGTIWFYYVYSRNYNPLMKFIALRSIERTRLDAPASPVDPDGWGAEAGSRSRDEGGSQASDTDSQKSSARFVNPSLIAPLEPVWVVDTSQRSSVQAGGNSRRGLETAINAV